MVEGKGEELKGRAKEAVGDLTDDERLEREGKVDRASGSFKQTVSGFVDKVKNAFRRNT